MASIFTRIIQGEIPSYKVAESRDFFAFLDIRPIAFGHTLVVPKNEVDYIFDMDDDTLSGLFSFAKKVSILLKEEVDCARIGVSVIGLEVPHAHVHLIPIHSLEDMDFTKERYKYNEAAYLALAQKLLDKYEKRFG